MKKIYAVLLTIILLLSLASCGSSTQPKEGSSNNISSQTSPSPQATTESPAATEPTKAKEKWGVTDAHVAENENGVEGFYINFPAYTGIYSGSGLAAYQADPTLVLVDRQVKDSSPVINGIDELFPAYFDQTIRVLSDYHGMRGANYEFTLYSSELVTVGDYNMCKYTGKVNFTYAKEPMENQFVAYATTLKSNGAYVYWMVLDDSEDQSLYDTIEEYAYKMAESLWEDV